ncbi:S8 family serine peptidase [Mesorhizobium sp. L48C026A00]|uniref:S8 family serine peptidase n=1 Tax=Mesorhizobium sp. L48C026A00 TaxID=1287182 RepID=UPI0003D014C5|nr:S8 family serine peptidase [Mesorhizobium sp. L48C026A00]ESZ10166.1 hypothetical protein X737_32200 [Mesorhizobium sp. L48C026A00]
MDLDYIIVRRIGPDGNFQNGIDGGVMGGIASVDDDAPIGTILDVRTEKLDDQQAHEANEDPETTAIPSMPVTLVHPVAAGDLDLPVNPDAVAEAKAAGVAWGITSVSADATPRDGAGVKVAVLDTGINKDHPAFAGIAFNAGNCRNFLDSANPTTDVTDNNGHGTHCAGTIFGRDVDGTRVGVARGVTDVLIGKVLDDAGRGSTASVLLALRWAGDNKANIISMSLGFDFPAMVERLQLRGAPVKVAVSVALIAYRETLKLFENYVGLLMLENASSRGTVVIAASGNESQANVDPKFVIGASVPAASTPDVISVGAAFRSSTSKLRIAPFSNINPRVSAPGVDVVSAGHLGGLVQMNGTSMACPHVAGVAALYWQDNLINNGSVNGADTRASVIASARAGDFDPDVPAAHRGRGNVRAPS